VEGCRPNILFHIDISTGREDVHSQRPYAALDYGNGLCRSKMRVAVVLYQSMDACRCLVSGQRVSCRDASDIDILLNALRFCERNRSKVRACGRVTVRS
jgi:hypothetical protein